MDETIRAYCTACDTLVELEVPEEGWESLSLEDLDCPHADLCDTADCREAIGKRSLREVLEFLPPEGEDSTRHGLADAGRMVEDARRASVRRERKRWIRWWGGR